MRKILQLLKPYKRTLSISLTLKSIGTMSDLFLPFLIAYMIDDVIPYTETDNLFPIYRIGILMFVIALVGWGMNIIANRTAEKIAASAIRGLRHDLFEKIEGLSSKQVDHFTRPSLISRMTTDTYNLYNATAGIQRLGVRAPVLLIGGIIMSFLVDPLLTLVMIATLPFIGILVYSVSKRGIPLYKDIQIRTDKLIRTVREFITGARVIKALSMSDHEKKRFNTFNEDTVAGELKAHYTMAKINPAMNAIVNVGLVLVLIFGAFRIDQNFIQKGDITAFVTYFTLILNAMMSITRIFVMLSRAQASGQRVDEVLYIEDDIIDGINELNPNEHMPHIEFKNVSFSYNKQKENLSNISFKLYKGQTLGIIGSTGSGKTTLINLLMRFYDSDEGEILYFGENIKSLKIHSLRKNVGLVLQQDLIFSESIYDNIQFNRSKIEQMDVEMATKIAQAEFIYEREDAFNNQMSTRGMNLSGGQKQRVLIARAIAGKPQLLILDDASSALDYQTDMRMRQALNETLKDTTKIIIAQRISSLKEADLILVMEGGRIMESGTHESLMASSKNYQTLAKHQMGGVSV
ncbi:MAG: ABC transporter ATP-binding protein [Acholeplasma sp.]|nr:ABC transporter ATP-binding protein [Acholeplasma sp.]